MRGARSLDVIIAGRGRGRGRGGLARRNTSRSLDVHADVLAVSTVSGLLRRRDGCGDGDGDGDVFNGDVVGHAPDGDAPKGDEDSPLLRKSSLHNRLDRPKKRVHDNHYIEFYKRWRSLENIPDAKGEPHRKIPRFAIRSWLIGIFNGGASRGGRGGSELRRAAPLLDRESAV